jgi:hypothetical protein
MSQNYSWKNWHPDANLCYLTDHEKAEEELKKLLNSARGSVLGFDIEWKPTTRRGERENPVALIQLANNATILLLQVSAMKGMPSLLCSFPASLYNRLDSPSSNPSAHIELQRNSESGSRHFGRCSKGLQGPARISYQVMCGFATSSSDHGQCAMEGTIQKSHRSCQAH